MKNNIRKVLWRLLGVDYANFMRKIDYTFLKDDRYTTMGQRSYENGAIVSRSGTAEIQIGNYCSIAQFVYFIVDGRNHTFSKITSFPLFDNLFTNNELILGESKERFRMMFKEKQGITVGNDVWIGSGTYIMPGVRIGNGVTIAANSVVTKDVPDYAVVAGTPARVVKMKHDDEIITKLNKIAWWNWETAAIKERIADFYCDDAELFIQKYCDEEN